MPNSDVLQRFQFMVHRKAGQLDAALADAGNAVANGPANPYNHFALARACEATGKLPEAGPAYITSLGRGMPGTSEELPPPSTAFHCLLTPSYAFSRLLRHVGGARVRVAGLSTPRPLSGFHPFLLPVDASCNSLPVPLPLACFTVPQLACFGPLPRGLLPLPLSLPLTSRRLALLASSASTVTSIPSRGSGATFRSCVQRTGSLLPAPCGLLAHPPAGPSSVSIRSRSRDHASFCCS